MKHYFFLLFLLIIPFVGQAREEQTHSTVKSIHFVLPINEVSSPKYNLEVTIPEGYVSLQPYDEWENASMIEFVPEGQDGENWTEIITVHKLINEKIAADALVEELKKRMLEKMKNNGSRTWSSKTRKSTEYTKATLFLSYIYQEKREILGAVYYSGPYDCSGVQYTIRPGGELTEKGARTKIEKFFENQIQVKTK